MSLITPRDYQREAHEAVRKAWAGGMQRPATVLPTGAGKTVVIATVAEEEVRESYSTRVLVLAHRDELIRQAAAKIRSVAPHLRVGIVKAGEDQVGAPIVVGSVQTLVHERRRARLRGVGLVIVDECFPAGTLVGGRPIERIRVGDLVPSWDESTGEVAVRPVTATMRRKPSSMVRVLLDDDRVIDCTPGHPILTSLGWCPAGRLWRGASVVSFAHDATATGSLHRVRENLHGRGESEDRRVSPDGADLLHNGVPGQVGCSRSLAAHEPDKSAACLGAHGGEQSNDAPGSAGEDGGYVAPEPTSADLAWGQWKARRGTTATTGGPSWMGDGGHGRARRRGAPVLVQRGHSSPNNDGVRGSGRGIPLLAGAPRLRSSQGRAPSFARVVDVQVLQPRGDGKYGGVCRDGLVYNLTVEGTNTYLVGDGSLVVHNCHHATAPSYRAVLDHYGCFERGGARALGFTATMSRGDGVGLGEVWEDVVYERDISYMITRGFLVKPRGKYVRVDDLDLSKVRKSGGDYSEGQLGEALAASMAPERIVDAYREHALGRPALCFVPTVDFARLMMDRFEHAGVRANVVHGAMSAESRRVALRAFREGRTKVLVNCMVLTEGTDLPLASCVIVARPTMHAGLYVQMVGRVLRTFPGKLDALVLDVVGASKRHALAGLVDLIGERDAYPDERDEPLEPEPAPSSWCDFPVSKDGKITCGQPMPCPTHKDGSKGGSYRDRAWLDGFLIAEEVDLFHGQRVRWQRTYAGHWFVSTRERYIAVVPALSGSGAWDVISADVKREGESDWVTREIDDLGYAMAHAESVIGTTDRGLAKRDAAWRKHPASQFQKDTLRRHGAILPEGATSGEASDVISIIKASARLDHRLPAAVS